MFERENKFDLNLQVATLQARVKDVSKEQEQIQSLQREIAIMKSKREALAKETMRH